MRCVESDSSGGEPVAGDVVCVSGTDAGSPRRMPSAGTNSFSDRNFMEGESTRKVLASKMRMRNFTVPAALSLIRHR